MNVPPEISASERLNEYGEFAEVAARAGGDVLRDWRDVLLFLQRDREILLLRRILLLRKQSAKFF